MTGFSILADRSCGSFKGKATKTMRDKADIENYSLEAEK
jgi:hypothetical protein